MTMICKERQEYADDPVYAMPRKEFRDPIYQSVSAAFNHGEAQMPRPIVLGYERVQLRWMKPVRNDRGEFVRTPDGSIKLVPR